MKRFLLELFKASKNTTSNNALVFNLDDVCNTKDTTNLRPHGLNCESLSCGVLCMDEKGNLYRD